MTAILSNAILAMLEHPEGGTLADLRRFLVEKPYRKSFLGSVEDSEVVYFWDKQFPLLSGKPEASVVTRLNAFLRPKPIRFMVCQKRGRLDLARVMDDSKILLVRLPFGLMGEENARLFGSLFVAKLHQLVMGRQAQRAEDRKPFWLYVDECHYVMTDSMASILSGVRKYGRGLVLAHQGMAQIEQSNSSVADALTTNAHIRACFRLGDRDAKRMAEGFSNFEAADLVSLPIGRGIGRVRGADQDFSFRVVPREAGGTARGERIEEIRSRSRALYGRPKAEVAAELAIAPTRRRKALPNRKPHGDLSSRSAGASAEAGTADLRIAPEPGVDAEPPTAARPATRVGEASPGESLHESLKRLLKLQAEGTNFSILTEEAVPGARVDLVLRKADLRVAIETSVGNDPRYEAKRMPDDLREGRIQALIFSKLARLARNTKELLDFADTVQEHDAGLVSLQEAIDTSTPAGRFFYTLLAAMAQWEREEISDRVSASVPVRAKLGKPLGGQATFGYRWQGKELVPDPDEAPVRRRLHELFAEHRRLRTVATILNEAGSRTRSGSPFSKTTVLRLLKDSTAKGVRVANYTRLSANGKKVETKNRSEWVQVPVEPVVSEELWNECARILEENARPARRAGRKPIHLFTGLTACQCGNRLYVRSNIPYYACQRKGCRVKISAEDLERLYRGELARYLHTREQVEVYLRLADETRKEKEQLAGSLRKEHRGRVGGGWPDRPAPQGSARGRLLRGPLLAPRTPPQADRRGTGDDRSGGGPAEDRDAQRRPHPERDPRPLLQMATALEAREAEGGRGYHPRDRRRQGGDHVQNVLLPPAPPLWEGVKKDRNYPGSSPGTPPASARCQNAAGTPRAARARNRAVDRYSSPW
jgi:DNA invertase Pin-like site-specific DNA recombinase